MGVLGAEAVGELVHVQRPDQDGACGLEALDHHRILSGGRGFEQDLGACGGHASLHVEQVLDREGRTGERPHGLSGLNVVVDAAGVRARRLRHHRSERVQPWIPALDVRQDVVHDRQGFARAGSDVVGDVGQTPGRHGWNFKAG